MAVGETAEDPNFDRDGAFRVFFIAHVRGVDNFVRLQIGLGSADVEDLSNEVFEIALAHFDEIGAVSDVRARRWLLQVARLRSLQYHRSRFRQRAAYRRLELLAPDTSEDPIDDFIEEIATDRSDIMSRTREVLSVLSSAYREVLLLDMENELSGKLMAARLNMTHAALRLRLMRARRAFTEEYERRFGNPFTDDGGEL